MKLYNVICRRYVKYVDAKVNGGSLPYIGLPGDTTYGFDTFTAAKEFMNSVYKNHVQLHRPEDGTWRLVNGNPMRDSWSLLDFECLDQKELEGGLKSTERTEFQLTKAVI